MRLLAADPSLLRALETAVAIWDRPVGEHLFRVAALSRRLGEVVGVSPAILDSLTWAGALHDLGELGIAEATLSKPGTLTSEEWEEVRRHPATGADMLLAISPALEPIASGVRSHHERFDGTGYPDGLAGTAIPLFGRIIAITDTYDALTHSRPYRRRALNEIAARSHLLSLAGEHFDPMLVASFIDYGIGHKPDSQTVSEHGRARESGSA